MVAVSTTAAFDLEVHEFVCTFSGSRNSRHLMVVFVLLRVKLSVRVVSKPKAMTLFGPATTSSPSSTSWLPSSSCFAHSDGGRKV